MNYMHLLITGGAGFIGSHFVSYILKKYDDISVINLDKLTYASDLDNIQSVINHPRYSFVKGDICDRNLVEELFITYQIDGVIHFAAETHVDNSIMKPHSFVETNVLGTFTLLEAARNFWMNDNNEYKQAFHGARFYHISTDEVYGTLDENGYFTENTPYAPNSPYSASKAASDMIVRSYYQTYGMNVITTNCSNNYGPSQHDEKLIPTIIRKALSHENIPLYGNGLNIRDWLYVIDHCRAIDRVFFEGKTGENYVIGGHNEMSNVEIAYKICDILDCIQPTSLNEKGITSYRELIQYTQDRPGHDFRYAIDDTKLRENLDFQIEFRFEKAIEETIQFYLNKYKGIILNNPNRTFVQGEGYSYGIE